MIFFYFIFWGFSVDVKTRKVKCDGPDMPETDEVSNGRLWELVLL
jgi:hypothetical protein